MLTQYKLQLFQIRAAKNIFFVHHADAAANGDPDTLYVSHIKSANVYLQMALDSVNANSNIALTLQMLLLLLMQL